MKTLLTLACLPLLAATALAQGLVIPVEHDVPPLALSKHAVRVRIDHQAATTVVEQVFQTHGAGAHLAHRDGSGTAGQTRCLLHISAGGQCHGQGAGHRIARPGNIEHLTCLRPDMHGLGSLGEE